MKRLQHDLGAALRLVESSGIPLQLTDRARKFKKRVDDVGRFRYMEVFPAQVMEAAGLTAA